MNKKAFFFDIDETLLSWITGEVPESAIYALSELRKKGHVTFINTGRMFSTVQDIIKKLPVNGFVCGCGTQIIYNNETIFLNILSDERRKEIVDVIKESDGDVILEGVHDCYFSQNKSRLDTVEKLREHFQGIGFGKRYYIEDDKCECAKFCFFADEKTDITSIETNLSKDMNIMDRGDGFYEVSPGSKAEGIHFILEHFGLTEDDAYVFGDSSNDLSMFQAVKHAIAMEKHDPILEPYTEFVTKTVEEDGILYALQHYGIL